MLECPLSRPAVAALPALLVLFQVAVPVVAESPAAWGRFAGPTADFHTAANVATWSAQGPKKLWSRPLGRGFSAVVADSRTAIVFYRPVDEASYGEEVVAALDPATGDALWEHRYESPGRQGHLKQFGWGPHATPLLLDERVITVGYAGELRALARDDGRLLWRHHLIDDWDGEITSWGYSASPIEVGGRVVVPVGGPEGGLYALDPDDGAILWRGAKSSVSYATPLVVPGEEGDTLVYFGADGLYSIDAGDGSLRWKVPIANGYDNHASQPILGADGRLWVASQQEGGARVLDLTTLSDGRPAELWRNKKLRIHHWNALWLDETVYFASGDGVQILTAVDAATGRVLWRDRAVGLANLVHTRGGTLILTGKGELLLADLSPDGLTVRARARVSDETTWTAPTVVGSRLYVRDQSLLTAFDLGGE